MPGLEEPLAKQLFCWHAFLQSSPPAEFETLVKEFLKACNGLPLSLKVLGAQLYGRKSKHYWKSLLHKILRILPREIKERLQVSYDALEEEEKQMFLDVACFLIGQRKSMAIAVWDGSGWSGLYGLETLVNKCLVELIEEEVDKVENRIRMHDHLRDMGREIANRCSPYRLWCPGQIDNTMKRSTRRELVRGLRPAETFVAFKKYTQQLMGTSSRRSKRLRFSNGLQILSVKGNEFTEEFASLSEDLVWLHWKDFPLRNIPSWLKLKNLTVLELSAADGLEQLWQDNADDFNLSEEFCGLQSLECLHLFSPVLSSLPADFGNLTSLRNINLKYCKQLSMLPDSFSQLINLEVLNLDGCEMLSSLPADFGNLTSLRNINLSCCKQLSMLPDSFSQLINLEEQWWAKQKELRRLSTDYWKSWNS